MSWAKIDDRAPEHRKQLRAGPEACWMWVCGLAYCNRQAARDGFIPSEALPMLYPFKAPNRLADRLVEAGLWDRVTGGFQVHEYTDWNGTASDIQAAKTRARERAAKSYSKRKRDVRSDSAPQNERRESAEGSDLCSADTPQTSAEILRSLRDSSGSTPTPTPTPLQSISIAPVGALALTPPGVEVEPVQAKPKRERAAPTAPHPVVVAHYVEEFERLRGSRPGFGSREGKAVSAILARYGGDVERAKLVITHGLSAELGNPQTILTIAADPDKWLSPPPKPFKTSGRHGPPQPNGGTYKLEEAPEGGF